MAQTAAEAWTEEGMEKGQLGTSRTPLRGPPEDRSSPSPEELIERVNALADPERPQAALRQAPRLKNIADLQL